MKFLITYFENVRGRTEAIKLMFEDRKENYELKSIKFSEWGEEKKKHEFGQLPCFEEITEEKTTKIYQSHAIYRRVAKRLNYYGKDEDENIRCEMIQEFLVDCSSLNIPLFLSKTEDEIKENTSKIEKNLEVLENLLKGNSKGELKYLVGDDITYVDFLLFAYMDSLSSVNEVGKNMLLKNEVLQSFKMNFSSRENIKEYLKSDRRNKYFGYYNVINNTPTE
jgi:glutathione S-transferase